MPFGITLGLGKRMTTPPLLVVGLGNPGPKYAGNRHNIGFMAVDAIAGHHGFPAWRGRFQGEMTEGSIGGRRVLLLKPMTFMNLSGQSVGQAARFFKVPATDVLVFHDELDLQEGKLRVKQGGGHAGHNGLRSLHAAIGPEYRRIRLGIGHPGDRERVVGHVLKDFAKTDASWLDPLLEAIAVQFPHLVAGDAATFMSKVAMMLQPPKPPRPERPEAGDGGNGGAA